MLRDLVHDLRVATRSFAARPAFTAVAVVGVALAIAASTVVVGVVRGLVLKPLPYAEPERLVSIWPDHFFSYRELVFLRENGRCFADVAGFVPGWSMTLTGSGEAAKLEGARVTANLLPLLGVAPAAGRSFTAAEEAPGADRAVVLSGRLWQGRFGGDPALVGSLLTLDGEPHTVDGVMPAAFELYQPRTEVWRVLADDPEAWYQRGGGLFAVARLADGVTVGEASAELAGLVQGMRERFALPDDYGADARVVRLQEWLVGPLRALLLVALAAVGCVLLLAGANLATLLLGRAAGRGGEMALRSALGASRARLARQLLAESTLLAVVGGAAGLAIAYGGIGAAIRLLPAETPLARGVGIDGTVVAAALGLTLGVGLLCGLAPALAAVRPGHAAALRAARASGPGPAGRRGRSILVAGEVALGTILVAGAALMVGTLWRLAHVDPGFRIDHVLTLETQPTGERFASDEARLAFYDAAFERLAALPEVAAVGAIQHLPLTGAGWGADLELEGHPLAAGEAPPRVAWRVIGGAYLRAMGIPLRAGRRFAAEDRGDAPPVVLVNEQAARRLWPGGSALGKRLRARNATGGEWATVVGVVADVRHDGLDRAPVPEMYRPLTQYAHGGMSLVLRTSSAPESLARAAAEVVHSLDRDVPVSRVRTLAAIASTSVTQPRTVMILLAAFALLALVVGAVGTYGVVAHHVAARHREIGVRMALGAAPGSVVAASLGEGLRLAALGAAVGVGGALSLGRLLRTLVYQVSIHDPLALGGAALTLVTVAFLASWLPARRAAKVDVAVALRAE